MSYQREREQFIATVTREGLPLHVALALLREATGIHRRAELACSSEAADRDRVPCPAERNTDRRPDRFPCLCDATVGEDHRDVPRIAVQDWHAEQRVAKQLPLGWDMLTAGDPRGYTLRVIPPSYAERNAGRDRFNLDSIGVPARESGITW